jgi:CarD family transcriptional regulator, regulator of rRNA transcription
VTFDVGTKVVYPVHGVAAVVGREHRTVGDETVTYLVLSISGQIRSDDLRLLVPEDRAEEIGVRHAVSTEDADDVLAVLSVRSPRVASNWSRRYKNHQEKLRSGDPFECAEVVRNLAIRQRDRPLAPAETAMYRKARYGLVSELAVTWGISVEDAADRVDGALKVPATP